MPDVLFASQPIYDRQGKVYAHELLYRHEHGITAFEVGDSVATSEVLFNLCTGVLDYVEHHKQPVCINVSTDFLLSGQFLPIAPEHVIIELVERLEPTAEIIEAIKIGSLKGFGLLWMILNFNKAGIHCLNLLQSSRLISSEQD